MPKKTEPENDALVQVVVSSFPKALLDEIEARAKRNKRSRAAEILTLLEERLENRRQPQAA